jgi:DMSO reductase anchor subunit
VQFHLTALLLGLLFAAAIGVGDPGWLNLAAASAAGGQLLLLALGFFRLIASESIELRGTARLLSTVLQSRFVARGVLLSAGGLVVPLLSGGWGEWGRSGMWVAILLVLGGEILGRYLFFVSVVPKHMAAPYMALESEAA